MKGKIHLVRRLMKSALRQELMAEAGERILDYLKTFADPFDPYDPPSGWWTESEEKREATKRAGWRLYLEGRVDIKIEGRLI